MCAFFAACFSAGKLRAVGEGTFAERPTVELVDDLNILALPSSQTGGGVKVKGSFFKKYMKIYDKRRGKKYMIMII